jgi:hypothetical protein
MRIGRQQASKALPAHGKHKTAQHEQERSKTITARSCYQ